MCLWRKTMLIAIDHMYYGYWLPNSPILLNQPNWVHGIHHPQKHGLSVTSMETHSIGNGKTTVYK